ncbi:MAG TPA: RluA family pseudouridine synthase [Gemmataceae bacterium]|nr:RluA family pseudouridine synthase [Gemmataceae bacterium]
MSLPTPIIETEDDLEDEPELLLPAKVFEFTVSRKAQGSRLDSHIVSQLPDLSRSLVQRSIESGKVTVNGSPAKASYKVRPGDQIHVESPEPPHPAPIPEDIPLDVLYEDDFLALVNKPYNMVVHPAKGNWTGTLANALRFRFAHLSGINGAYRPGIVHRLDRDTSGVILVAKEEQTHRELSAQFENRKIFKEYISITAGVPDRDSDYIERRIRHHPHDRIKMMVTDVEEASKEACSFYEVVERFRGFCLVKISPRTGRTHQIRVHLASIHCPVLADKVYSGRDCLRLSDLVAGLSPAIDEVLMPRQALHAHRLRFTHPRQKRVIEAEAPLPADFQQTLAALRRHKPLAP